MSNIENRNNTNNFTELDKVFIPRNLDEKVDIVSLSSYRHIIKGFQVVPENYSLVKKNVFTQKNKNVSGFGVKFFAPLFTKTILVSNHRGIKKYCGLKTFTVDGEEIDIDFGVIMQVIDPAKYIVEGKNKIGELTTMVARLLRIYISTKKFDEVIQGECELSSLDPDKEFEEFMNRYGVEIQRILIERVELSESLKKLYNDAAEEKQKRLAQAERLKAEQEKAQSDAKVNRIQYASESERIKAIEEAKNDAYVDKIAKLCAKLKASGFSAKRIDEYIKTMILADNGNAIFLGNNTDAQNIATGVAGGQHVTDNLKGGKQKSNTK